ncbi:er to golgi transport protein yif1 [Lichtheimia corymbifera JMRC:FSU:9682]|uniref:Protein YIF1 n=1 Tax=Lichtheimia corymbifera JMRC:FSU:9682 TaxID=1263082 RepID=A0A068S378_9FUNG|nr:er to golgi transport protein yif1 [Lichtheimia corymbifera JMRC:FSU:9682]
MYNPQSYQQHPQHRSPPMNTRSPPPLQHPVPQHPIPNFSQGVHQASPHMPHQQQQYQQYQQQQHAFPPQPQGNYGPSMATPPQQQQPGNMYQFSGLNDPTAQIGMQFAGSAVAQGTAYVERNFNRWVDMPTLRHYFNVNNLYVMSKIKLILFPWRHSPWSRAVTRSETGQMEGFRPPREDINSPDLYIPVMAIVTYILLCGLVAGQQGSFHPEQLYVAGWTSIGVIFSELVFTRLGCYFLNIPFEASMLDLVAYSGYKYVCIIVSDLVKLFGAGKWLSWMVFIYTSLSVGFFLLRSMRYVILPDAAAGPSTFNPQRKRRMWFLLMIATLQIVFMFALVN